jgi:hypothetical protein
MGKFYEMENFLSRESGLSGLSRLSRLFRFSRLSGLFGPGEIAEKHLTG